MITTLSHGKGGHFHDLKIISESLSKHVNIVIINIGLNKSPVINQIDLKVYNIYFNGVNIFSALTRLVRIFKLENPSFLHSFDIQSFCFARILSFFYKIPAILMKCGGLNPNRFYPFSENIIVMSLENLNYFNKSDRYKSSKISCIPNRCVPFFDNDLLCRDIQQISEERTSFLRISRITEHYKSSLIQSINLVRDLNVDKLNVCLFIVGVVQSKELFKFLKEYSKDLDSVYFLTQKKYTYNASSLINACDVVIGTGRGVMEAAYKRKIILTPHQNSKYPVLIEENNFHDLFYTNFSPRNQLNDFSENDFYNTVKSILSNNKLKRNYVKFINEIYIKEFDFSSVIDLYLDFYNNLFFTNKYKPLNFFRNLLATIKTVYFQYSRLRND